MEIQRKGCNKMNIISTIKGWFEKMFKKQAEDDFNVKSMENPKMTSLIKDCADMYAGSPYWLNDKKHIKTVNFAKTIASETARLVMLGTKIEISGSARAAWLNEKINNIYFDLRKWVEYALAYGTVFIKPNDKGFDIFTPFDVILTEYDNLGINGIIFKDTYEDNGKYYTRLEYHRFINIIENGKTITPYYVSNKAYVSNTSNNIGKIISLDKTKWANIAEDSGPILKTNGESLDSPMFGILTTPQANNIDISTPLGMPIYAEAIEELKDLDIAYSRNAKEIYNSERTVLADDRLMIESGNKINNGQPHVELPEYVKNVFGDGEIFYQEINPSLDTEVRLIGINALLSQIGYKCGYSNGYFVFNEKTNMATATQVESDDRRTIQLIKDCRDRLESCLDDAVYAMSVYADLYGLAPIGNYEIVYDFGDITYSREEDRLRWMQYVSNNQVPAWMYFVKFEGMSEEDAKAMVSEAQTLNESGLYDEE